ncbi:MAG: hypothetical protein HC866_04295 [Leptolyngbyaceae cyanobacterium RU_5_1]|nr:hypothetical protein [Leptolyngbyaceae cyanobacterium RU_5_1]
MNMLRQLLIYAMVLTLAVTTVSCGNAPSTGNSARSSNSQEAANVRSPQNRLSDGQYPVQQATYNDANGEYSLMLLNTKPGDSPTYRTANLQMARLTNEDVAKGQKSYLKVENGQLSLYLTEDFKIEYVHNVAETQTNPQTGQQETVVVRQESSFWTPFAGALAGQALGSLLFRPQYYVPPVYQPGGVLTGYGGYGRTYDQAVGSYRQRYNAPPAEVRNRQTFRSTGQNRFGSNQRSGDRATGSGYGSNTLRRSNSGSNYQKRSPSGFGSSSRSRSLGRRR